MKKREYRIGPGAASLLLVAVVVSLSMLALMALINARGDHRLTERSVRFTVSEYTASAQAERSLAQLDAVLAECAQDAADDACYLELAAQRLPEGMYLQERTVHWEEESQYGRTLMCAVELAPLGSEVRYAWTQHSFDTNESEIIFE